jgi:hypothetical protein
MFALTTLVHLTALLTQREQVNLEFHVMTEARTPIAGVTVYLPKTGDYVDTDADGRAQFYGDNQVGYWEVGRGLKHKDLEVEVYGVGQYYNFKQATNYTYGKVGSGCADCLPPSTLNYDLVIPASNGPGGYNNTTTSAVYGFRPYSYWELVTSEELECTFNPDPDNPLFSSPSLGSINYPESCSGIPTGNADVDEESSNTEEFEFGFALETAKIMKTFGIDLVVGADKKTTASITKSVSTALESPERPDQKGDVHIRVRYVKLTFIKVTIYENVGVYDLSDAGEKVMYVPTGTCHDTSDLEDC